MSGGILLRDPARNFGVEFESLRHREIFEISARADKKLWGATLNAHNFDKFASYGLLGSVRGIKNKTLFST